MGSMRGKIPALGGYRLDEGAHNQAIRPWPLSQRGIPSVLEGACDSCGKPLDDHIARHDGKCYLYPKGSRPGEEA